MTFIQNEPLKMLIKPKYSAPDVQAVSAFLNEHGTLTFRSLPNGLFPASVLGSDRGYTGYSYVWVRDNIHIAHAHYRAGFIEAAARNLRALMAYFIRHRKRFLDIVEGAAAVPMNRPHVRFEGSSLEEVQQKWAHAQNDALGYFLWLFCKLMNESALAASGDELEMLALFPRYFETIRYWQDEDSGHWEEVRKISASSIGAVVAGLKELRKLRPKGASLPGTLEPLIERGQSALREILPWECNQPDPSKRRRYDAALLFLIYPLEIVEGPILDQILADVRTHLQGEIGIRRYLGDSYWAPDYKKKLKPEERTADFSDDPSSRDQLLPAIGQEAQWCIFDPIVSCIFGLKFQSSRSPEDLAKQTEYFNRSLGQITAAEQNEAPAFRCPELYYLENGRYVSNDHVPLQWTQANLLLAIKLMEESCAL